MPPSCAQGHAETSSSEACVTQGVAMKQHRRLSSGDCEHIIVGQPNREIDDEISPMPDVSSVGGATITDVDPHHRTVDIVNVSSQSRIVGRSGDASMDWRGCRYVSHLR